MKNLDLNSPIPYPGRQNFDIQGTSCDTDKAKMNYQEIILINTINCSEDRKLGGVLLNLLQLEKN